MLATAAAGFFTGVGLIVAIGAQNAFVLRQGLARNHVLLVVGLCAISDAILITAGVAGMGTLISASPGLLKVLKWLGAGYLIWFGAQSLRSALSTASGLDPADPTRQRGWRAIALTTLALTWLNPHVYLDTVVMLGSIAHQYSSPWVYAAGAATGSVVWFSGLGFGARLLSGPLSRSKAWIVLDSLIAITMFVLAIALILT